MNAYAHQLTRGVLDGDRRAIAMAITVVEAEGSSAAALIKGIYHRSGRAYLVGVTGAPGVGKSTLLHLLGGLDRADGGDVKIVLRGLMWFW